MDRSQTTGALIMAGAALQLLIFLAGLTRKSYFALALPVMGAMAALSALAFWVGWTMLTTPADNPDMELDTPPPAQ